MELVLPSILTLHSEKYIHLNIMKTEAGLSSKRYHKAARRFYGAFKKETELSLCLLAFSRNTT